MPPCQSPLVPAVEQMLSAHEQILVEVVCGRNVPLKSKEY